MFKFKIVLAGAKNVGKSSLIARFCDDTFNEKMKDTIGVAFKRKSLEITDFKQDTSVDLIIWDFAGEEKYRTLFPNYLKNAAGALVVYDITRKETLDDVENWVEIIEKHADDDVAKVLIGAKCDLEDQRAVSKKKAMDFCDTNDFCSDYIETSAKTGANVEEAFKTLTLKIIDNKNKECPGCGAFLAKNFKICKHCGVKLA